MRQDKLSNKSNERKTIHKRKITVIIDGDCPWLNVEDETSPDSICAIPLEMMRGGRINEPE